MSTSAINSQALWSFDLNLNHNRIASLLVFCLLVPVTNPNRQSRGWLALLSMTARNALTSLYQGPISVVQGYVQSMLPLIPGPDRLPTSSSRRPSSRHSTKNKRYHSDHFRYPPTHHRTRSDYRRIRTSRTRPNRIFSTVCRRMVGGDGIRPCGSSMASSTSWTDRSWFHDIHYCVHPRFNWVPDLHDRNVRPRYRRCSMFSGRGTVDSRRWWITWVQHLNCCPGGYASRCQFVDESLLRQEQSKVWQH